MCLSTAKLSKNKLDALVLNVGIRLVGQMLSGNSKAMSSVANAITLYQVSTSRSFFRQ